MSKAFGHMLKINIQRQTDKEKIYLLTCQGGNVYCIFNQLISCSLNSGKILLVCFISLLSSMADSVSWPLLVDAF